MISRKPSFAVSRHTMQRYLASLTEQLLGLRQAADQLDYGKVREICHRLRGSAGLFGLGEVEKVCSQIEDECRSESFALVRGDVEKLESIARQYVHQAS